ncbi:ester hydrolase C11orf54 homolog isoform X5 [Cataglyphis hispanica]|uniref:ester hydrolase C11orf54 homolog isoform X5 n=1 Tax=Cataglyphis hispanica TaxID=1086592 RepID=UPI00217F4A72|nr:ester hydrolase C11orf54 homolog isoform X5 [Cataglyphis hispanica]XP_050451329.1 ester hydrolase C11orf54 homolog isoform X5 [Cataglyphis hispanica]XP_050451330.1 ester hydrolase C11orf54 homolog isoform X5 [Cataglyphis hispanica]XP_050451331.1 ester hydrolase C11orf54 homolog isoform X5 [Cataglyphis hispanica]XP_050451332.1 ester hydrolase C11orf54 homolog isoform X5 [Cataglyphis hispanica]
MGPVNPLIPIRENYSPRHEDDSEDDTTWSSVDSRGNGIINIESSHLLFTPTLEDLKNVLYVALNPYFEEFEIAVVSCPCLTRAPYNLAAVGLSGNTGILELGHFRHFSPRPQTDVVFDFQDLLSRCSNDAFVIGSGLAAKPSMPSNGHLTMNAVVSANHRNVINNSCIAFKRDDELRLEIINGHNQIKCCLFGHFFFSEGKRGPVIKIRAKGRRSRSNIIALIQTALSNRCQNKLIIGLGIVLVINGGKTAQFILPHDFINYDYNEGEHCHHRFRRYALDCENLIALGALMSEPSFPVEYNQRVILENIYSMFNILRNSKSGGNFFNDVTPEETEYIVYINVAQEKYYKNYVTTISM